MPVTNFSEEKLQDQSNEHVELFSFGVNEDCQHLPDHKIFNSYSVITLILWDRLENDGVKCC